MQQSLTGEPFFFTVYDLDRGWKVHAHLLHFICVLICAYSFFLPAQRRLFRGNQFYLRKGRRSTNLTLIYLQCVEEKWHQSLHMMIVFV